MAGTSPAMTPEKWFDISGICSSPRGLACGTAVPGFRQSASKARVNALKAQSGLRCGSVTDCAELIVEHRGRDMRKFYREESTESAAFLATTQGAKLKVTDRAQEPQRLLADLQFPQQMA